MRPAALVGDMHTCPMVTGIVPHVGGPILPPPAPPTALLNGRPIATVGCMATCVGPPDSLVMGSPTVLISGKPVVRMGDTTAHGGVVIATGITMLVP